MRVRHPLSRIGEGLEVVITREIRIVSEVLNDRANAREADGAIFGIASEQADASGGRLDQPELFGPRKSNTSPHCSERTVALRQSFSPNDRLATVSHRSNLPGPFSLLDDHTFAIASLRAILTSGDGEGLKRV